MSVNSNPRHPVRSISEEMDLTLPVFDQQSVEEESDSGSDLSLPQFEREAAREEESPDLSLTLPVFDSTMPQKDPLTTLTLPVFEPETVLETELPLPPLTLPLFDQENQPARQEQPLNLPTFEVEEKTPAEDSFSLTLPEFKPVPLPREAAANLTLPVFAQEAERQPEPLSLDLPSFADKKSSEEEEAQLNCPAFEPSDSLPVRGAPLNLLTFSHDFHPVMKQFASLAKSKSYEEIVDHALKFGSLGDLRMLQNYSALKTKYLHTLFDHLIAEIPFLLPKTEEYTPFLENSQQQIKLWEEFLNQLSEVKCFEELAVLIPFDEVKRLSEPRPHTAYVDAANTAGLLRVKDFLNSFFSEILQQEKKRVVPNDLKDFEKALAKLGAKVREEFHALRMESIHRIAALDFSKAEMREPQKPVDSNPKFITEVVSEDHIKRELQVLQKETPRAHHLRDFTNHALSFTDLNLKGKYLLKLAQLYTNFNTVSALKMAITWIDQALLTITDETLKQKGYEQRGAVWLKMSQVEVESGLREKGSVRKRIDLCYRDYHTSLPLSDGADKANYVREKSFETDPDYAEARYAHFLKKFEQLELDSPRLLPSHYRFMRDLEQFKRYLLRKCGKKEGSQFKLTLATGAAWVKFEGDALYLHSTELDALLTSSIKNVQVVEEKIYSAKKITKEQFKQKVRALDDTPKRLKEIEEGLQEFHLFELSAFYKSSLLDIEQNRDDVLSRLDYDLHLALLKMHAMAVRGYSRLRTQEDAAAALAHAAKGIRLCDRLLKLYPDEEAIKEKKMDFLLKKGALYNQLNLCHNETEAWEEALLFAKRENARFFNPSLHYTLACCYQTENRLEEAKEQLFTLVRSPWAEKNKNLLKKAEKLLDQLEKEDPFLQLNSLYTSACRYQAENRIEEAKELLLTLISSPLEKGHREKNLLKRAAELLDQLHEGKEQDPLSLMGRFKEKNIQEECLQILRDEHLANSLKYKKVPIWDSFLQEINQTTTLRSFFEVLFANTNVSKEHLLLLAQVSNSKLKSPKELDSFKLYVLDSIAVYHEVEAREDDQYIEETAKATRKRMEVQAFHDLKKALQAELKKGKNIRPGSDVRLKMDTLKGQFKCADVDGKYVLNAIQSCFNSKEFNNEDLDTYFAQKDNFPVLVQELTEILEFALDTSNVTYHPDKKENVLRITGRNIFLHQIVEQIKDRAKKPDIVEVHITGVNVYIDTSFDLKGINLAVGGKYVEFLRDKNNGKLRIDLSGNKGKDGDDAPAHPAPKGAHPGKEGDTGKSGEDAKGGEHGGDFCIESDEELAGADCVEMICLNGGEGGKGGNGQTGGVGADGEEGKDARTDITPADQRRADAHDELFNGHTDFRRGTVGGPGGDGGLGGSAGAGGMGGHAGRFLVVNKDIPHEAKPGGDGGNGSFGVGGEPGKGGATGLSHVKTRKFSKFLWFVINDVRKERSALKMHWAYANALGQSGGGNKDADLWVIEDGTTKDDTRVNGTTKGRGKTAEERGHKKHEQERNKLKEQLFKVNLAKHLSKESAEGRAYAFDSVTNQLAKVKDTEEILKDQCAEKKRKLKDIDNLRETTKTVLQQTQHEKKAQIEQVRLAAFSSGKKIGSNASQEIEFFLKTPEKDNENLLPFHLYNPDLHKAIYPVNVSKGKNVHALAHLVEEMEKEDELFDKLEEIVENLSPEEAVDGFEQLVKAVSKLPNGHPFKAVVLYRDEEVKAFKAKVLKEKEALEQAFDSECCNQLMQIGIYQFFLRDRLLHNLLKKEVPPDSKEWGWFKARLKHQVHGFAKQVYKNELSVSHYCAYALDKLTQFKEKKGIVEERRNLQRQYKSFRRQKEWIMEHLNALTAQGISIQEMLKETKIDQIYLECTKIWTALPSQIEVKKEEGEEPPEEHSAEYDWLLKNGNWKLEAQAKTLQEKGIKNGNILAEIKALQSNPDFAGLAEIYTSLAAIKREDSGEIVQKLKTDQVDEVFAWRKNAEGDLLPAYFEKRHIVLTGKNCVESLCKLNDALPAKKALMESSLRPFLEKVNLLYRFYPLLPADFLKIAHEVVEQNPLITLECMEKENFEKLEELVLNRSAKGLHFKLTNENLIAFLSQVNQEEQWRPCLFLLLNRPLKYAELAQVIEKSKKFGEVALSFLRAREEEEMGKFDQQWQGAKQRALLFDQYLKKGEGSIELLLKEIEIAASLFQNDEKIKLLGEIVEILVKNGPFASLAALKAVVARLGSVPNQTEYNTALEALIVKGKEADLEPLFMQIVQRLDLANAIVAVNHIPLKAENLIALYKHVNSPLLQQQIKSLLALNLREQARKLLDQTKLEEKQQGILKKFQDLVMGTQILHPEQYIAKFKLWMTLSDSDLYESAYKVFFDTLQTSKAEEAIRAFDNHLNLKRGDLASFQLLVDKIILSDQIKLNIWTEFLKVRFAISGEEKGFYKKALDVFQTSESRADFNQWMNKRYTGQIENDDAYAHLLKQLEKKDEAEEEIENRYWQGVLPYSSEKDEATIVKLLEGKEASIATRKLLKRKVDPFMVHDDCNKVREKVLAARKKKEEELKEWAGKMQTWLLTQKISHSELQTYYPLTVTGKGNNPPEPEKPQEQKLEEGQVREYLKELTKKIEEGSIREEDSVVLKHLKGHSGIEALEKKLIDLKDRKEQEKKQEVDKFLEALPFEINSDHPLHASLAACFAMMGEDYFLTLLKSLTEYINEHPEHIRPEMLHQLFWAIPRIKDQRFILEVLSETLPERWALALLERHCLELLKPSVHSKLISHSELKNDELILEEMRNKKNECADFVKKFKNSLNALIEMQGVNLRDKELLLRLFAERLTLLNEKEMEFSIDEFARLIGPDYLLDEGVVKKVFQSSLSGCLVQPLFQNFKYVITYAWIEAMLQPEPHEERLIEALFTIESVRKEQAMRSVVEALKGSFLTPSVSDAVEHFADQSWELDEVSLKLLKNRNIDAAWYAKIEEHTRMKRSQERDLETLVSLMAEEKKGINQSIQELLGEDPLLVQEIEQIKAYYKEVKGWSKEEISDWAKKHRGPTFPDDVERLKKGIAIVSHASELAGSFSLRDTQLIAVWIMLRKGSSERGRIAQLFTGEGKSIIFASLAVLRAMSGSTVDVITTSYLLAKRDAEENEPLFKLFDLTVSNNCDLECEANEEVRKKRYNADIIYGDVGCFERDLLLTEFHGKAIIPPDRLKNKGSVFVDEVDGLFLDNAGMVLYLSHNVDSLRFIGRVFEKIWILANQANSESPIDDRLVEMIIKAVNGKIESEEICLPRYQVENARYIEMKEIIQRKLPIWVRSALQAKVLRPDKEYIVADQVVGGKKKKSVTVMDMGTGVEQFSLKWNNGLHQFLQLKHALDLGDESLKAVFLSNYFYFKRYGSQIYGLSGTLGSDIEQKYLRDLYQVDLCKIPRFKGEKYIQHKAQVAGSWSEWLERIKKSVDLQIKENRRAALIICESVEEVNYLQKHLKEQYPDHHVYLSSLQELPFLHPKNPTLVRPGDLIIATNLAGRGTDLKTDSLLEANHGLHVILSYLPRNIRIQDQAFGRTARKGQEGSGEFIIMDPDCRTISELIMTRDLEEKKRLESVASKEVKKIEFEQDLLRGIPNAIEGFETVLNQIKGELQNETPFYQQAQLESLKNRWAFWLDHMEEKISLVHTLGREGVIASYQEFVKGVLKDFQAGGFRLIKEPAELIKLGGEYRREKMWTNAEECYREAIKDPHYEYARYYMAFCSYAQNPDPSLLKKQVKKAALSVHDEIDHLQNSVQSVVDIAERRRKQFGESGHGNPYKQRTEEKLQVWSIFLSSIDSALGGSMSGEKLKTSSFVKNEEEGTKILEALGPYYKKARLSKKWDPKVESAFPAQFKPALAKLKAIQGDRSIDKQKVKECCGDVFTQEKALTYLKSQQALCKFTPLSQSFKGWPSEYSEVVKFLLEEMVKKLCGETFATHEEMISKLKEKQKEHPSLLAAVDMRQFFEILKKEDKIVTDHKIDISPFVKKDVKFTSLEALEKGKEGAFTKAYKALPLEIQNALFSASRRVNGDYWYLENSIFLNDLNLFKTTADAGEMLWTVLENQRMIKPGKMKVGSSELEKHMEQVKENVKGYFKGIGKKDDDLDNAVTSIFDLIDGSIGMVHKLHDKKSTAEFAAIIRKCFLDHHHAAPEGLNFFIELGLEAIANLVEKKDPPAWYEVTAVIALGVIQMVAGVIIKAYVPVAGQLIGGALINSGMDDVMFGITSAISGEFSWADYAKHKGESLKRSIISSAIGCGISYGVSAAQLGSFSQAWDQQLMCDVDKLAAASKLPEAAFQQSFNLGSYVATEMGRNFIAMGVSQIASRGLEGMTKVISSSYESNVKKGIENAVNSYWPQVMAQADALYDKVGGDALQYVRECVKIVLKMLQQERGIDAAVRESKQYLPQASGVIADKGWSTFFSYAADITKLGISIPKLNSLVDNNAHALMREIRNTVDHKEAKRVENTDKTEYHKQLDTVKGEYTKSLIEAFNQTLSSSVYAPLVSMGTTFCVQKMKDALLPQTEQEQAARSAKTLRDILETEKNPGKAFYDEPLRKWRGATNEVKELTEKELEKTPENGGVKIKDLRLQYGSLLKVYKDSEGHLYVQRPTRDEYVKAIREGKASGDPELSKLSEIVGKNIELRSPDGKVKIFTPDGKMSISDAPGSQPALRLDYEQNSETGIGHIAGIDSSGNDCLYQAIIEKEGLKDKNGHKMGIQELRDETAKALETESGKRLYHDWSLQSGEKEFVGLGKRGANFWYARDQLMIGTLEGVGATLALPEIPPASFFLYLDSYDHLRAGVGTLITGKRVDTGVSKYLQYKFGLSPEQGEIGHNVISSLVEMGPALMQGGKGIHLKTPAPTNPSKSGQHPPPFPKTHNPPPPPKPAHNPPPKIEKKIDVDKMLKDLTPIQQKGMDDYKNGLTNAGFAMKHGDRAGSVFPRVVGHDLKNEIGQFHLEDIITHPQRTIYEGRNRLEIYAPDGRGVMVRQDGSFYFIELPNRGK